MSAVASALPDRAWRSGPVLAVMSRVVGSVLGVGRVRLIGRTPNGHRFVAHPRLIWRVTRSSATVAGENVGPIGPLQQQAHLADFWIPQRGLFMVGATRLRARQQVEKGFTGQEATHVQQMTSRRLPCPEKQ